MIEFEIFPNMKNRCVTFSFDAGHGNDMRIVSLLNKYGIKATFYLGNEFMADEICELYKGHEISYSLANESYQNKEDIRKYIKRKKCCAELISNYPVMGASMTSGELDINFKDAMKSCGIKYCRLISFTMNCKIPDDFMEWRPSCNVKGAFELCNMFVRDYRSLPKAPLLHIFAKSSELKNEEDWIELERILKSLANNNTIWYATNTEVYEYISAQRNLLISADEKSFYNPTNIDIWIKRNHIESFCVPAGRKISFRYFE